MPTSTRRQARFREQRVSEVSAGAISEDLPLQGTEDEHLGHGEDEEEDVGEEDEEVEEEDEDEILDDPSQPNVPFPPPGLKEISSLASWTVSTAKPGSGVAALRSPSLAHFWQSDGPQPHLLSIHFFKLVSIAHMRIFLDFESDESYTPTKIQFLAGYGAHDVQEFAEMSFEQPTGWVDVDFSNVGPITQDEDEQDAFSNVEIDWSKRPVLRAFVVQVRILENHQNGKDTHLRAVQIFARDEAQGVQREDRSLKTRSANVLPVRQAGRGAARPKERNNIKLADWMMEPDLR